MRLILHFDINKTILISDPVSNVSTIEMLNSLFSECVWGKISQSAIDKSKELRTIYDWELISSEPSSQPPNNDSKFITFGEFIENYTNINRKERKIIKNSFTTNPDSIGYKFKDNVNKLDNLLKHSNIDNCFMYDYLSQGYYHIIPAFFHTIQSLNQRNIDYRIVFRTFGIDCHKISKEYNLFCENKHPLFPLYDSIPMDGSNLHKPDRRLHIPKYSTKILRTGPKENDLHLGYVSSDETTEIITGAKDISNLLNSWFDDLKSPVYTIAIRDDFNYWNNNFESDESGKILLIDNQQNNDIQIFFDDNIERDRAHIIDVRELNSFEPIPFSLSNNKYIFKVEPYLVIQDNNYFINIIDSIIKKYTNTL